jgi:uncharacterized protein
MSKEIEMKTGFSRIRNIVLVVLAAGIAGCASSPPSRFYTLTSPTPQEIRQAVQPVSVSMAPVEIPDYLDRPQMVTREGLNGLRLAEYDRWLGSLSDNIATVLAENLTQALGTDQVFLAPLLRGKKTDYAVSVRILRLDCTLGDQVFLKAQWSCCAGTDRKDCPTQMVHFTERLHDGRYETMVAAVSRTLELLSREIAGVISDRQKEVGGRPNK